MAVSNVLSQLRDIHMPAQISAWPSAPGWYMLGAIFALGIFAFIYILHNKYRRERAKKLALLELITLRNEFKQPGFAALATIKLSRLIRRTALAYYPRNEVAALTGNAWLSFLDRTAETTEFSQGVGQILITAPYSNGKPNEPDKLLDLVATWINKAC